jgi:hypothetical protein
MSKQGELEKAIEYFKRDSYTTANKLKHSPPFQGYIDNLEDRIKFNYLAWEALEAKIGKPCWYCDGIQDHKVVSVKTVVDEFGRELPAYDTPYNYCPACGRKLN